MSDFELYLKKAPNKELLRKKMIGLDSLESIKDLFEDVDTVKKKATQSYLFNIDVCDYSIVPSEVELQEKLYNKAQSIFKRKLDRVIFFKYIYDNLLSYPNWKNGNLTHQKGALSEFLINIILKNLKEEKVICDYMITKDFSLLDMSGVDVEITFVTETKHDHMPLQIKSSHVGQIEHIEKYGENIPSIIASDNFDLPDLKRKIKHIIHSYKSYGLVEHV